MTLIVTDRGGARRFPVRAKRIGDLAVHPTLVTVMGESTLSERLFTVSHVHTGGAILCLASGREEAVKIAGRLQQLAKWDFRTLDEFDSRKGELSRVRQAVKKEFEVLA
jgi:hypothetical protein